MSVAQKDLAMVEEKEREAWQAHVVWQWQVATLEQDKADIHSRLVATNAHPQLQQKLREGWQCHADKWAAQSIIPSIFTASRPNNLLHTSDHKDLGSLAINYCWMCKTPDHHAPQCPNPHWFCFKNTWSQHYYVLQNHVNYRPDLPDTCCYAGEHKKGSWGYPTYPPSMYKKYGGSLD